MRTATMAEWKALIERLRQRGAPADLLAKLASGAIGTFHTETGEMLSAPLELAGGVAGGMRTSAPVANAVRPRGYGDLSYAERHELATSDWWTFRQLRFEWSTWRGRTYSELTRNELVELYRTDRERFERMLDAFLTEQRKAG